MCIRDSSTTVPIAAGERLFTRWAFRELLENKAISVFQPDICHVGGIFEGRKIAAMAEMNYATVAPVSYTHLDVYKRQLVGFVFLSNRMI